MASGSDFITHWRGEKLLMAFLAFAFLSVFWSVSLHASIYRTSILFLSTLSGAYIGYRFGLRRLIDILFWFGAIVVILSCAFSVFVPDLSVASGPPYYGSWKGIYWHRNHLGALSALFNGVFLLRTFANYRKKSYSYVLDAFFYVFSLVLVYLARSAAGYILTLVLHASVILAALWLRFSPKLKNAHYLIVIGVALIAALLIFSNLEFVFGLLNRKPSLTGRIPMWTFLLQNVVSKSPWIGYGFGAIWTLPSFRIGLQHSQGWGFQILIGDNGFMDILLHLGTIGLVLFIAFWSRLWVLSFKHGIQRRTLTDFFPLLYMIYTLFANISFSLFLEVELFVWMTMIAVLFALKGKRATLTDFLIQELFLPFD